MKRAIVFYFYQKFMFRKKNLIFTSKMYNPGSPDLSYLTKICDSFLKFVKNLQS